MRLALEAPKGWRVDRGRHPSRARAPEGVPATLEWSALALPPTAAGRAVDAALAEGLPADAIVEALKRERVETIDGWPVLLVDAWVLRASHVLEMRLLAFYELRALAASALLRVGDEKIYFGVRQEVMPALLAARPDYRDAIASVAQFWAEPDAGEPEEEPDDPARDPR